jgi:outer membrane protein OmpA-like peptidoglycan-associated protein
MEFKDTQRGDFSLARPTARIDAGAPAKLCVLLALCVVPACAHHASRTRASVSAVTNEEVTGTPSDENKTRMHYTVVGDRDSLNHDQASLEHQAMTGTLDRGSAPTPALSSESSSEIASARAAAPSNSCDDTVTFESNSAVLSDPAKDKLSALAECMKRKEVDHATVVGKSDPVGTPKENVRLGKARAQVVANYLRERGVDEASIRVTSLGEAKASQDPKAWPNDRQAQVEGAE